MDKHQALVAVCSAKESISTRTYDELVHYYKYASSAYVPFCPRPNGQLLVTRLSNMLTDIQGFIVRDDKRKEIVLSLRGSLSVTDFILDFQLLLVPFSCPGVTVPDDCRVHSGFLIAWTSVVTESLLKISNQLSKHPDYSVVTVGHSLGGALATLSAATLLCNHPEVNMRTYSYGSPRVGNTAFARWFNEAFQKKSFRVVHANDGVPTMIPKKLGYHHHGVEYWQHDPPKPANVVVCNAEGEDASCSASVPSRGFNPAHLTYFGIAASTPYCM